MRTRTVLLATLIYAAVGMAGDWPRFLGPRGDGRSDESGILTDWSRGLEVVWQQPVGEGYAAPSVAGGRAFVFDRVGDEARLRRLRSSDGNVLWRRSYPTDYEDAYGFSNGPRSTPVVDGERVFTLGAEGRLRCHHVEDGRLLWEVDTTRSYGVVQNFFGVGGGPVVEGELLVVMVGGSPADSPDVHSGKVRGNGSAIVAFDKKTGEERYRFGDELASYASLQVAELAGARRGVAFTRGGLLVFDPAAGRESFFFPWRAKKLLSVNAATPVLLDDRILVSEGYGPGSAMIRLTPAAEQPFEVVWSDAPRHESLLSHWATPVHHDGVLYGCSGEGSGEAELRAVEAATGKVRWRKPGLGRTTLLYVDGHLVVLTERGRLLLVKADPSQYREVASWTPQENGEPLLAHPSWNAPVLSNGLLLLRGRDRVVALRLIAGQGAPQEPGRPAPSAAVLRSFVEGAVTRAQALQGRLIVYDEKARSNRELRFVSFLDEEPRQTGADTWALSAVCAGRRGRRFVLDFWVRREEGEFKLGETRVRGAEGRPRYRWQQGASYWEPVALEGESNGSSERQGKRQGSPSS